jgi:hypothetical protein
MDVRFVAHPSLCLVFALAFLPLLRASDPSASLELVPDPKIANGRHIVLLSGDEEYRSEESMPMLGKILTIRHGFRCSVLFALDPDGTINPDNLKSLGGAEALDSADVIVMALRYRDWPDDVMKHFVDAYRRGVPIIALRTSTHAFRPTGGTYKEFINFGKIALGEQWVDHWGHHRFEATRGLRESGAENNPLLNGVTDVFGPTDVYEAYPPADAKILLRGQVLQGMNPNDPPADHPKKRHSDGAEQPVNDPMMPIAWTRLHRNDAGHENRVLCTTMGAARDLENESLRRLIVNGVYWALKLDVPARADVSYVGEYHPSDFSFGSKFRHGLTPADYASPPPR